MKSLRLRVRVTSREALTVLSDQIDSSRNNQIQRSWLVISRESEKLSLAPMRS
jgi:hypothetical protein